LVNLYAEPNPEGSKYPFTLYNTAGQIEHADTGTGKPIQGSQKMGALLYVVSGNEVFTVDTSEVVTSLGTITIASTNDRVMMSNNGTQMSILTDDGTMWVATSSTLVKVTDPDFPSASSVTFLDGFTIVSVKDSGQFQISALLDSTMWDALDFATAEEQPDNLVSAFAFNGSLWLFGETSIEIYYNTGNADFPFEQITGAVNTTRGCGGKFTVVPEDNGLFFLGDDKVYYRASGYTPQRISTHGEEREWNDYTVIDDAFTMLEDLDGHKFVTTTFPTENATWSHDIASGLWHERTTLEGTTPVRWSPNEIVEFDNKQLAMDNTDGKIYELSPTTYTDGGTTIERIAQGSVQWQDGKRITYDWLRLDMDAGVGLTTGQGSDPQVMMSFSDNGGIIYSNEKWRSFGKIGEYFKRIIWRRLGTARERIYRFRITDPVAVRITGCYAKGRIGTE